MQPIASTVPRAPRQRMSRLVFTLNNYTEQEYAALKTLTPKWMIIGKEVGETGTPHLQGAMVLGKQVAFSTIKRWPGMGRAHVEPMRGTPSDSKTYCSKEDGNPYEYGSLPEPGKRNDLQNVAQKILAGSTMLEIAMDPETAPMIIKYHKGLTILREYTIPKRDRHTPPTVVWLHGTTGTGKTETAFDASERLYGNVPWISNTDLTWFDGYDGQPAVIFDDLRTRSVRFEILLRLLDRYPIDVPIKGGFVSWRPRLIIITAPYDHRTMWSLKTNEQLEQLSRRITLEASAPEDLSRVYELLCIPNPRVVVPVLPRDVIVPATQQLSQYDSGDERNLIGGLLDQSDSEDTLDMSFTSYMKKHNLVEDTPFPVTKKYTNIQNNKLTSQQKKKPLANRKK